MVNILLLVTGSVAAIKLGLLLDEIHNVCAALPIHIRIVASTHALHFIERAQPSQKPIPRDIFTDAQEWSSWNGVEDEVLHISLRRWADCVLIAPLDANTLAKLANGLADNLLTCVMRAWDMQDKKPLLICPAMNTAMWNHPITQQQLQVLRDWYGSPLVRCTKENGRSDDETAIGGDEREEGGSATTEECEANDIFQVIDPVEKRLACGEVGIGGMASVETIALALKRTLERLENEKKKKKTV